MAVVTKKYLIEQIQQLIEGGNSSAGAKYDKRMIESFLQQAVNAKLKSEYFNITLPGGETIPEGLMLASYDNIAVEQYKGLSRVKLPAMPISLRRGMGIVFVGPATVNAILSLPVLTATAPSTTQINLSWTIVPHATSYYIERATNSGFTIGLTDVYLGNAISYSDIGLITATLYYYRITAKANGYTNSIYGTTSRSTL